MNTPPASSVEDCRCDDHRALRRAQVLRSVARRYRNRAVLAPPPAASAFRGEAATMEAEARRLDDRTRTSAARTSAACDSPAA